jgi:hypothetical protein
LKRRSALITLAAGIVGAIIALVFRDEFIAAVRVPYGYAILLGRTALANTPQIVVWGVLVSIGALIFLSGAFNRRRRRGSEGPVRHIQHGRIEHWIRLVSDIERGEYFRWRLTHHLSELVLNQLSFNLKKPVSDVRQMLLSNEIALSTELLEYLIVGQAGRATEFLDGGESSMDSLTMNAESILNFMEREF